MRSLDDYSMGIALCCTGSVVLVAIVLVGIMGWAGGLVPLIAFSLFLHAAGLVLVVVGVVLSRLRTPTRMYYDWGLFDPEP